MPGGSYQTLEAENVTLKQRVGELERRVAELEAELTERQGGSWGSIDVRDRLWPVLFLTTTLLLAAVPSALVVRDRWLGQRPAVSPFQDLWCRVKFFCQLAYPPYFVLVFVCFLGVLVLIALWKDGQLLALSSSLPGGSAGNLSSDIGSLQSRVSRALLLGSGAGFVLIVLWGISHDRWPGWNLALVFSAYLPGWLLREVPVEDIADKWRRNQGWLVALCLAEISLILLFAGYFAEQRFRWVFVFLLLLAIINLRPYYRKISPIVWVMTLALILFTLNINAWWLSTIGDEYSFFYFARDIADRQSLAMIGARLFDGEVVYGTHPYFSSLIQAIFMKLLGSNGFGWRFSNTFLSAVAIGFFFLFFRTFVPDRTALIASLFLAVSHYIMSFGKIGYNNLQAFFAMSLALSAGAWAVRTRRWLAFVVLGTALALCFYVYPAALYVIPLPLLLLLFYDPPTSEPAIRRWGAMIISLFVLIFPLLLQPDYWETKMAGTFLYNQHLIQTIGNVIFHFASNLLYAFFSFVYIPEEDHFIAASYVDPLTAVFVAIGIACLLRLIRRERFVAFFLISFAVLLFLVGASHDRLYPTGTRMFLLLPCFALFAAVGLVWVLRRIEELGLFHETTTGIATVVVLAALGLNLYQAYPLSRERMAGFQSLETLFFRLVQRAQATEAVAPKTYVFITDPTWTSVGIQQLPQIYPVQAKFEEVVVTNPMLPEPARATIADRNALVIIKPWMEESWKRAFEPALRELGKVPCDIKTTTGDVRFTLWHAPELAWLCE